MPPRFLSRTLTLTLALAITLTLALCLTMGGANTRPLFMNGGQPGSLSGGTGGGGGGAPTFDCGTGGVCATHQSGQTFVTWTDAATGATGASYRYRMYRSASALNAGNCTSGTLIASYIPNNSGQLYGGDPTSGATQSVNPFTQSYRQTSTRPMSVLTNLGTPLAAFTGLQVYTATGNGNAYYCIVSTNTSDTSPAYIGAVGPIAETVATPQAIKYADSLARGQNYGKITGATNLPVVYRSHASSANGGCNTTNCQWGDYWQMWLTPAEGWQDGRPVAFSVSEDVAQRNPSLTRSYEVLDRDTVWTTDYVAGGMELGHTGIGMTPNPLVGPANRFYPIERKQIERILNWTVSHFSADPNAVHWRGKSMGAWGGASAGIRMTSPRLASMWLEFPVWRMDRRSSGTWAGLTWGAYPFRATVGAPPSTLGTTASSVLMGDGTTWGGAGGYADIPSFIAANPGTDLPFVAWSIGKYDPYPASGNTTLGFSEQLDALNAFQSAKRGHAFCWATMAHDTALGSVPLDRDAASGVDAAVAYRKDQFKLNLPYVAFTNSSIDDNPGTATPTASGLLDGDYLGCKNAGFTWNVSSDTAGGFNFTVGNPTWMTRNPTTIPTTTLVGSMAATGSGSVAVTSTAGWLGTNINWYALVGNAASPSTQEVVFITGATGNTVTFTTRGLFGTTAQAHGAGVEIRQLVLQPTGPNGGPYSTMTVDVTPRRVQNFIKADGSTVSCTITPFGAGSTNQTPTVANGLWTLSGVTINSGGVTTIACG